MIENLVSVIIPSYNRSSLLERSIRSCLEQTHPEVEVIVVDDGSTDNTPQVVQRLQSEFGENRLRYERQPNQGPSAARNTGMALIRGEFLQFLDSDDYLDLNKFSSQIELMRKERAEACSCEFTYVEEASGSLIRRDTNDDGLVAARLSRFRGIHPAVTLIRSDSVPRELRFDRECRFYEDRDFFFRYYLGVRKSVHIAQSFVFYTQHPQQLSGRLPPFINYEKHFKVNRGYWTRRAHQIPAENRWMIDMLSRHLLIKAYLQKDWQSSIRMSLGLIAVSRNAKAALEGCQILIKSILLLSFDFFCRIGKVREKRIYEDWYDKS